MLKYLIELRLWIVHKQIFVNYAVFCNGAIAFVHSPGMKTARKQAEKVDVLHEYVGYCVTHRQQ
ncbi:hypothetical protein [Nostoc sp.]|uniref:hypothetical protein n=1 Tax=Nostoc sp. TaxID=1180 RepID=UPI002FF85010